MTKYMYIKILLFDSSPEIQDKEEKAQIGGKSKWWFAKETQTW